MSVLDLTTEAKLKELYPDVAVKARRLYEDMHRVHGLSMRMTEALRDMQRQADLYAQGRTKPGKIVTNSMPGLSLHHYGLAFDSCFLGKDPYLEKMRPQDQQFLWSEFGRLAEAHGLTWGGNFKTFKDRPHCELTFGLSVKDCLELYRQGRVDAVWKFIDRLRAD